MSKIKKFALERIEKLKKNLFSTINSSAFPTQTILLLMNHILERETTFICQVFPPDICDLALSYFQNLIDECFLLKFGITLEELNSKSVRMILETPTFLGGFGIRNAKFDPHKHIVYLSIWNDILKTRDFENFDFNALQLIIYK